MCQTYNFNPLIEQLSVFSHTQRRTRMVMCCVHSSRPSINRANYHPMTSRGSGWSRRTGAPPSAATAQTTASPTILSTLTTRPTSLSPIKVCLLEFMSLYLHLYFHCFNILYRTNKSSSIDDHRSHISAQWYGKTLMSQEFPAFFRMLTITLWHFLTSSLIWCQIEAKRTYDV